MTGNIGLSVPMRYKSPLAAAADSLVFLVASRVRCHDSGRRTKMLSFACQPHVGAVTYGAAAIGSPPRTVHGYLPEFEARLNTMLPAGKRGRVAEIAAELGTFYAEQWKAAGMPASPADGECMNFLVAGYDEGEPYGHVYVVTVPNAPDPVEQVPGDFGMSWGGQTDFAHRLFNGFDPRASAIAKDHLNLSETQTQELSGKWAQLMLPVPFQFLPLQDCVDLSRFLVTMTSAVQTWTIGVQGVGGAVDVATITRTEGFSAIRQKQIEVAD